MTQPLTMECLDEAFAHVGLPSLEECIVAREQVAERLDLGVTGVLTLVQAPTGAGKTIGAASWASRVSQARGLVWIGFDHAISRPNTFLARLIDGLGHVGVTGLPVVGLNSDLSPARRRPMLAAVADAMRDSGPLVLVVDDFPTGPAGPLGADLEFLMRNSDRALRVVILASAVPAIELHRLRMAGEVTTITPSDLDLRADEIADLLGALGIDASQRVVDEVRRHTHGWAAGVRLAADVLATQPLEAAMKSVARTIEDYVVGEVLEPMPPDGRDLVLRASLLNSLPLGLASAIAGADCELASVRAAMSSAFVQYGADGTLRLHPLLREVARARLRHRSPEVARAVYRSSARWYADQHDLETSVALASQAEDWSWAARQLVDSCAVPRILDGTYPVERLAPEILDAEPVLGAAAALMQANSSLASGLLHAERSPVGDRVSAHLSRSLVEMELARRTGDLARGAEHVEAARGLVATLPLTAGPFAADCVHRINSYAGAIELAEGRLHQAAITLERAATVSGRGGSPETRVRAMGYLALVEAIRGNLRRSVTTANEIKAAQEAFGQIAAPAAPASALLATAWVHVDRLQLDAARMCLGTAAVHADAEEPLIAVMKRLLEARQLIADGLPESAVRVIAAVQGCEEMPAPGWLADMVRVQLARALICAGEPRRALAVLTPEPEAAAAVEARVVATFARLDIGDARGASALLLAAQSDLGQAPLGVQIEAWLLEARLSSEPDRRDRARLLVDRALRAAGAEELRSCLAGFETWLRSFVGRDPALLRAHRRFLASLPDHQTVTVGFASDGVVPEAREHVVEPLTDRECQVLEMLAMMCSTDEIAAKLFVSGNTVKTHVKGIFRKLGVNRRVDAVRAGRDLGIC